MSLQRNKADGFPIRVVKNSAKTFYIILPSPPVARWQHQPRGWTISEVSMGLATLLIPDLPLRPSHLLLSRFLTRNIVQFIRGL